MKIGILSDCHLGMHRFRKAKNNQNIFCELNNKAFENGIKTLLNNNVDCILIPGDLFDSPNPSVQSVLLANKILSNLNIPVYLLGGNHDYSQINNSIGIHPFELLYGENIIKVYNNAEIFDLEELSITMIPYKNMNSETFGKIYRGDRVSKKKKSMLVIHGYVDLNNSDEQGEFNLPKAVASNYDTIICGHIHLPFLIENNGINVLTCGSLMPSAQANEQSLKPSVYIFDTETNKINIFNIECVPKIHEIVTDNINKVLEKISNETNNFNDIYFIKYNGKIQDMDEFLYKKSLQNSLNLSIQTYEDFKVETVEKVSNFWTFISENYPEYFDEFKLILKGES